MRIVVVGAGVIGCAVAFECARRGAEVQVVDERRPGGGATRAAAGILAPYIEGHTTGLRELGVRGLHAYPGFLAVLRASGVDAPEFGLNGTLQAAFDDEGARDLGELAGQLADAGVEHRRLDGSAARALEPGLSNRVIAALEIPAHGYVDPEALTAAMAEGAVRHGAALIQGRVTAIGGSPARVEMEAGSIDADAVVVAAGSWVSSLAGGAPGAALEPAVRPIRGQLLHVRTCAPVAARVLWGPGCYLVPRLDNTVLIGATVEDVGFDERATLGGVRSLVDAAAGLVPGLDAARLVDVRVGLRPATADELPIVGPSATMPQVYYAAGHYRSGVLLAPLTAGLVADLVLDGRGGGELDALRPARFGL